MNFGVFKTFRINEQHQFQFRSEFFNLFNRVNLGNPNMVVSNASFGRITSASYPRVIQLARFEGSCSSAAPLARARAAFSSFRSETRNG